TTPRPGVSMPQRLTQSSAMTGLGSARTTPAAFCRSPGFSSRLRRAVWGPGGCRCATRGTWQEAATGAWATAPGPSTRMLSRRNECAGSGVPCSTGSSAQMSAGPVGRVAAFDPAAFLDHLLDGAGKRHRETGLVCHLRNDLHVFQRPGEGDILPVLQRVG